MDYLPLFLKLHQQRCLIVGGGDVATRKARLLLQAGAALTIAAPELTAELAALRDAGQLQHKAGHYAATLLDGQRLVIAATDDAAINATVYTDCEARGILVNAVDDPGHCRFIVPAIVDRSPLVVAVSSGGNAPVLARMVKARLETWLPHGYGLLAALAGKLRDAVKQRLASETERRRFWEDALDSPAAEQAMGGDIDGAQARLLAQLEAGARNAGAVYLVGAGPGNPDLLTFRALHLMQKSDVVLYDNLVSPQILELVRRDAERIYVGKKANNHALPQEEINQLLVRLAQQGKRVLRLKGGDPFIFGRGGEEIAELAAAGIPFEVVPGITSAAGASCYAGIPLTHRDHAQSVTFVTGHRRADEIELDWPRLVNPTETVVVYMGVKQAPSICQQLIAHGRAADTPVAIVERATWPDQRTIVGTLATLPALIEQHTVKPPALIIIGSVVSLHDQLDWRHAAQD
ncbi:uroporphyrin-III C-methyltransferase / precorrin-2 dehydrogenase / sirohydrochlorin ferrochelatase [Andreprevotia lacus DSM 23236]|jgi:uroporphyrin-III C-methyltransferase/precorrin-2 dehydrogenase/sirohydrochlorin ferrochelatase|uniref:Siroheme synthase n=1 Tax=Andreprevotia lacus DSM 23236 TaxID=1121001 RepID=A0A1W1XD83_9NEIS|nr:siroheme synthase CysG [Andreprevotia lacus]SMC21840.1 uroporphyrin-III C-methyltransferase / precorrin-2 dehydrogenase / sirohydrochlorin ferrochelatase [Andreprevotia lacus DSM 23236]